MCVKGDLMASSYCLQVQSATVHTKVYFLYIFIIKNNNDYAGGLPSGVRWMQQRQTF